MGEYNEERWNLPRPFNDLGENVERPKLAESSHV